MTAVGLSGAGKTFSSGTIALAPTTLSIAESSFVSIVGPSGCGKSTLLRLIAGLIAPTEGALTRRDGSIGFVFQEPTLMPWATTSANVALPLHLHDLPASAVAERVRDAISRVGLDGFADAYPRELSGGMKMRASIARAIVTSPQLLLMDEPFAALDEFTRFKLNDDLLSLWHKNRWTVLFVTHSVREAVFLAERVIVMSPRPGRVIADLAIDLPPARNSALRSNHAFTDQCARVTAALGEAQ